MKFLLKCGINLNELDDCKLTALNYACKFKYKEIALLLKEKGGILNNCQDLSTKFCEYGFTGELDGLRLYYQCGANLNLEDYDNRTVAHLAASQGHANIIKFLVEETNFNIMISDRWGNTPFTVAKNDEIKAIIKKKYKSCK